MSDAKPDPSVPESDTFDPTSRAELSRLPSTVLIALSAGGNRRAETELQRRGE